MLTFKPRENNGRVTPNARGQIYINFLPTSKEDMRNVILLFSYAINKKI